jgi:hypothetical protein
LCDKVILAYVKDEGANLNMFANALTRIVSWCVSLMLPQLYVGSCMGM